jgi:hypothetical protein
MIKLKSLLMTENLVDIKWIVGYVDNYGHVHYKVVYRNDPKDSHELLWNSPKIGKWRWLPSDPNHLNTYGNDLDFETEDSIWRIVDKYR